MRAATSRRKKSALAAVALAEGDYPKKVLTRLAEHNAIPNLEYLVRNHADRKVVLTHLHALGFLPSKHVQRQAALGINSRQAQSLVSAIHDVAGRIERVGSRVRWQPGTFHTYEPYLRRAASQRDSGPVAHKPWLDHLAEYLSKTPRDWRENFLLPCMLHDYADALESYLSELPSLRKNPPRTAALCQLIWHVKEKTGRYLDTQVSALINAAENRPRNKPYLQSAHQRWRKRNALLVARIGQFQFVYPAFLPGSPR